MVRVFWIFILLFGLSFAKEVDAVLKIEKEVDNRAKISLIASSDTKKFYRKKIDKLFVSDFKISGHFLVDKNIKVAPFNILPINFSNKSLYTLIYRFKATSKGGALIEIKLFKNKKQILKKDYSVTRLEKAPFLIHKAVSDVNNMANYPSINWINRYVVLSKYIGPRETEIILADYSFTYKKTIIKGGLNLFPKWADKKQRELYFSNYDNKDNLVLYKLNIYSGKKKKVIGSKGMLACSDISRDGSRLLLTMAPSNQPDIYLYNSGGLKKLTTFSGIDVGGKFADNEQSLVFVSNRLGYPNIFKKSLNGGSVVQLVHHGKNNGSCDAYNDQVVYSSKERYNKYNIYLTNTSGSQTRPLTSGGVNQFPRFSYDGKVIMYIKRVGNLNSIGFINISANISEIFKLGVNKIQSIDW